MTNEELPVAKVQEAIRKQLLDKLPVLFHRVRVLDRMEKKEERAAKTKSIRMPDYRVDFYPLHSFYKPISRFDEHGSEPSSVDR